ncbi:MAG: hypothetical protein HFJ17_03250 [Clostridia bacterium]|nr:hypothetical protein [Clostridia bacterium]
MKNETVRNGIIADGDIVDPKALFKNDGICEHMEWRISLSNNAIYARSRTTVTLSGKSGYETSLAAVDAEANLYSSPETGVVVRALTPDDVNKLRKNTPKILFWLSKAKDNQEEEDEIWLREHNESKCGKFTYYSVAILNAIYICHKMLYESTGREYESSYPIGLVVDLPENIDISGDGKIFLTN